MKLTYFCLRCGWSGNKPKYKQDIAPAIGFYWISCCPECESALKKIEKRTPTMLKICETCRWWDRSNDPDDETAGVCNPPKIGKYAGKITMWGHSCGTWAKKDTDHAD